MAKKNNAPAQAGATSKEVTEKEVVAEVIETTTEVIETTTEETAEVIETTTEETAEVIETTTEVIETTTEETAEVIETTTEETTEVNETADTVTLVNGEFEVNGRKHKLSDRCPAKLQINGKVYSREELLTNEEVLKSLVIGESPFVKKA